MKGGVPVCIFDNEMGMFRIIHAKGKAISSFGVSWTIKLEKTNTIATTEKGDIDTTTTATTTTSTAATSTPCKAAEFLFIEEALFLHERGLLHVYDDDNVDKNKEEDRAKNTNSHEMDDNEEMGEGRLQQQEEGKEQLPQHKLNEKDILRNSNPLDTQALYEIMLHRLHIPLQVYLTYSHLRSQTYIVTRHTANRLDLVRSLREKEDVNNDSTKYHENNNDKNTSTNKGETGKIDANADAQGGSSPMIDETLKKSRKRKYSNRAKLLDLRSDTFHAPVPFVFGISNDDDNDGYDNDTNSNSNSNDSKNKSDGIIHKPKKSASECIAFDVYKPNSQYRKSDPGPPDFYVAISNFAQPSPPFVKIKELIQACDGIPLRMAAVADGGTVIMFGLTDYGVPDLTVDK